MECKLELSVFRFDAKTDFLPYYKKHIIKIDRSKTVNDLLALIQGIELSFGYPKDEFAAIKINSKALYTTEIIDDIVTHFGKTLTLEPLSTRRVVHDMIIDDGDFYASFDLLDAFVDSKDKALFKQYIIYHYASSVLTLEDSFQGDALFAFAYDMIQKHPNQKNAILQVVADSQTGIFLHVKLCNKIFPCAADVEQKISALKNEIMKHKPFVNSYVEKLSQRIDSL
ncbi:MAG: DUF5644 domain-containing protein [Sulfurospirillaceae bacterium]|nr:DUF5644 domain-containing protein [Sulfurospirillaceae bacterium]MDD2826186.1 DUF5644 domain-containing protein [Sulfurospirillaceae bacterium]